MPNKFAEPFMNYWYQALHSACGIEIACSEADSVKSILYVARKDAHDLDLEQIKVTVSPFDPTKLWLVKKDPVDAAP